MKPSTSLMMGIAPSLIRRVSSSAMPVLAFPWRMAAYMRSSFRLSWLATATHWRRRLSESTPRPAAVPLLGRWQRNLPSNLIWRKVDRAPLGHAVAFLPLEHDCRPPQTAGTFLRPPPGVEHAISNSGLGDPVFPVITSPVTD